MKIYPIVKKSSIFVAGVLIFEAVSCNNEKIAYTAQPDIPSEQIPYPAPTHTLGMTVAGTTAMSGDFIIMR